MTRVTSDLTDAGVVAMLAMCLIFVVNYTRHAPWWEHRPGRAMVSLDVANILILLPSVLYLIFHVSILSPFFNWYRVVSLFLGAGTIYWRTRTISYVNAQVHAPKIPPAEEPVVEHTTPEEANDAVCPE